MEIKQISDQNTWDSFFKSVSDKTFVNSWEWGEFQKKIEDKIWRFGVYDKDLISAFLAIKVKARRGTFLFLPHGPANLSPDILKIITNHLKNLAKKEGAGFVRIAPICERNRENEEIFNALDYKDAPIHIHPENSWQLDISGTEDEILLGMRKTTRYLIKQAEKNKEIEVIQSKNIEEFSNLLKQTAKRHHFVPFSLNYLKNQVESFDDKISVFLAKYRGEIVSGAVIVYWQGTGYYHHGALLPKHNTNKVPVSYLVQWKAILAAKQRGCKLYNFWGVAEELKTKEEVKKSNHPWAGLTLFKMGFGGKRLDYLKTKDLPVNFGYHLTRTFEKLRRIKRRL